MSTLGNESGKTFYHGLLCRLRSALSRYALQYMYMHCHAVHGLPVSARHSEGPRHSESGEVNIT